MRRNTPRSFSRFNQLKHRVTKLSRVRGSDITAAFRAAFASARRQKENLVRIEVLEDRAMPVVPTISQLGLMRDTGTANDLVSWDGTLFGAITDTDGVSGLQVNFDINGDGKSDGVTTTNSKGEFTFTPNNIPLGSVTIVATPQDWDGQNGPSKSFTFTYSSIWSEPISTTLELGNDNGPSTNDKITTDALLKGTVTHQLDQLYLLVQFDYNGDGSPDATVNTDVNNKFEFRPTGLSFGPQTIKARAGLLGTGSAPNDNSSPSKDYFSPWTTLNFELKANQAPTISNFHLKNDTGASDSDLVTRDPTFAAVVSNDEGKGGVTVEIDLNNDQVIDKTVITDADGKFEYKPEGLEDGKYTFAVRGREWSAQTGTYVFGTWSTLDITIEDAPIPVIADFKLKRDTGENKTDNKSSDPTVVGQLTLAYGSTAGLDVQLDYNGDGKVDQTVYTDAKGQFTDTPRHLSPGPVTISARGVSTDEITGEPVTGAWSTLTFTLLEPEKPIVKTIALLDDDGVSQNDLITSDPRLLGTVTVDGQPDVYGVEFDHDLDGSIDGTATTKSDGSFLYQPLAISAGVVTLRARGVSVDQLSGDQLRGEWVTFVFTYRPDREDGIGSGFDPSSGFNGSGSGSGSGGGGSGGSGGGSSSGGSNWLIPSNGLFGQGSSLVELGSPDITLGSLDWLRYSSLPAAPDAGQYKPGLTVFTTAVPTNYTHSQSSGPVTITGATGVGSFTLTTNWSRTESSTINTTDNTYLATLVYTASWNYLETGTNGNNYSHSKIGSYAITVNATGTYGNGVLDGSYTAIETYVEDTSLSSKGSYESKTGDSTVSGSFDISSSSHIGFTYKESGAYAPTTGQTGSFDFDFAASADGSSSDSGSFNNIDSFYSGVWNDGSWNSLGKYQVAGSKNGTHSSLTTTSVDVTDLASGTFSRVNDKLTYNGSSNVDAALDYALHETQTYSETSVEGTVSSDYTGDNKFSWDYADDTTFAPTTRNGTDDILIAAENKVIYVGKNTFDHDGMKGTVDLSLKDSTTLSTHITGTHESTTEFAREAGTFDSKVSADSDELITAVNNYNIVNDGSNGEGKSSLIGTATLTASAVFLAGYATNGKFASSSIISEHTDGSFLPGQTTTKLPPEYVVAPVGSFDDPAGYGTSGSKASLVVDVDATDIGSYVLGDPEGDVWTSGSFTLKLGSKLTLNANSSGTWTDLIDADAVDVSFADDASLFTDFSYSNNGTFEDGKRWGTFSITNLGNDSASVVSTGFAHGEHGTRTKAGTGPAYINGEDNTTLSANGTGSSTFNGVTNYDHFKSGDRVITGQATSFESASVVYAATDESIFTLDGNKFNLTGTFNSNSSLTTSSKFTDIGTIDEDPVIKEGSFNYLLEDSLTYEDTISGSYSLTNDGTSPNTKVNASTEYDILLELYDHAKIIESGKLVTNGHEFSSTAINTSLITILDQGTLTEATDATNQIRELFAGTVTTNISASSTFGYAESGGGEKAGMSFGSTSKSNYLESDVTDYVINSGVTDSATKFEVKLLATDASSYKEWGAINEGPRAGTFITTSEDSSNVSWNEVGIIFEHDNRKHLSSDYKSRIVTGSSSSYTETGTWTEAEIWGSYTINNTDSSNFLLVDSGRRTEGAPLLDPDQNGKDKSGAWTTGSWVNSGKGPSEGSTPGIYLMVPSNPSPTNPSPDEPTWFGSSESGQGFGEDLPTDSTDIAWTEGSNSTLQGMYAFTLNAGYNNSFTLQGGMKLHLVEEEIGTANWSQNSSGTTKYSESVYYGTKNGETTSANGAFDIKVMSGSTGSLDGKSTYQTHFEPSPLPTSEIYNSGYIVSATHRSGMYKQTIIQISLAEGSYNKSNEHIGDWTYNTTASALITTVNVTEFVLQYSALSATLTVSFTTDKTTNKQFERTGSLYQSTGEFWWGPGSYKYTRLPTTANTKLKQSWVETDNNKSSLTAGANLLTLSVNFGVEFSSESKLDASFQSENKSKSGIMRQFYYYSNYPGGGTGGGSGGSGSGGSSSGTGGSGPGGAIQYGDTVYFLSFSHHSSDGKLKDVSTSNASGSITYSLLTGLSGSVSGDWSNEGDVKITRKDQDVTMFETKDPNYQPPAPTEYTVLEDDWSATGETSEAGFGNQLISAIPSLTSVLAFSLLVGGKKLPKPVRKLKLPDFTFKDAKTGELKSIPRGWRMSEAAHLVDKDGVRLLDNLSEAEIQRRLTAGEIFIERDGIRLAVNDKGIVQIPADVALKGPKAGSPLIVEVPVTGKPSSECKQAAEKIEAEFGIAVNPSTQRIHHSDIVQHADGTLHHVMVIVPENIHTKFQHEGSSSIGRRIAPMIAYPFLMLFAIKLAQYQIDFGVAAHKGYEARSIAKKLANLKNDELAEVADLFKIHVEQMAMQQGTAGKLFAVIGGDAAFKHELITALEDPVQRRLLTDYYVQEWILAGRPLHPGERN